MSADPKPQEYSPGGSLPRGFGYASVLCAVIRRPVVHRLGGVRLLFDTPQRAVTPGQAAVVYDGDTVLGGGELK